MASTIPVTTPNTNNPEDITKKFPGVNVNEKTMSNTSTNPLGSNAGMSDKNFLTIPNSTTANTGFVNNGLPSVNEKVQSGINNLPSATTPITGNAISNNSVTNKPITSPNITPTINTGTTTTDTILPLNEKTDPLLNKSASTIPTQTTGGQGIDQIVDQMFPKGSYTDEERQAMRETLSSKNTAEITSIMADNAKGNYQQSQELLKAYRTTRDFGLTQQRNQTLSDQRLADLNQSYDNAIQSQKQKMEADANNMAVVMGGAGRLQSRNLISGVNQMLDNNKQIYSQLVSNKDRDIARLGEDLKYAQTVASNEYNDMISQEMQDMLKGIQALDKTGSLNTAQGLVQARSFIDATISNSMSHQSDYYNKLNYISQRFDQYHKEALANQTVDENVTKMMGDGFLYNPQGGQIKDENGKALQIKGSTSGTLIQKEPITLNDGSKGLIFQNNDGSIRVEKIVGTEASQVNPEVINKYANAFASGLLQIDDLVKLGLPQDTINQIVGQVNGKIADPITPYQQAQLDQDAQKLELEKTKWNSMSASEKAKYELDVKDHNEKVRQFNETNSSSTSTDSNTGIAKALDEDIKRIGGDTALTGGAIESIGNEYGVNPAFLGAVLRNDSSYGAKLYSKNNYGNVGNNDSLVASGKKGVEFATPEEGIKATANNLKNRIDTYKGIYGKSPTVQEVLSGVGKDGKKFFGVYMTDKSAYDRVDRITKDLMKGGEGQTSGGNISEDPKTKAIIIGNLAYGKTITKGQSEQINDLIKKYPNASSKELSLAVKGFDIKDNKNTDLALNYINFGNQLTKKPEGFEQTVSNYINSGNINGLNQYVTHEMDKEVQKSEPNPISSGDQANQTKSIARIINLIDKNKSKIGKVQGNLSNFANMFSSDKDYTELKSLLQGVQATQRKYFAGSAVTPTELQALENFIGGTEKMDADNLKTQITSLNNQFTQGYLSQRGNFGVNPIRYNLSTKTPTITNTGGNKNADNYLKSLGY